MFIADINKQVAYNIKLQYRNIFEQCQKSFEVRFKRYAVCQNMFEIYMLDRIGIGNLGHATVLSKDPAMMRMRKY